MQIDLSTGQDVRFEPLAAAALNHVILTEGLSHVHRVAFASGRLSLDEVIPLADVELADRLTDGFAVLLRMEPRMVVYVWSSRGNADLTVAGDDREAVDRVAGDLMAALRDPALDGEVPVTFWAHSAGRPMNPRRRIAAPEWSEIRGNYAEAARGALDELMRATEPGPGGLLLWHGEPGTGKTHALRALASEWRGWCDTHFITDPDAFLGGQTNYLLSALLRTERGTADDRRWRLVVLEDAGELLAADARALAGQALSRLLNLTDGLLGAGLRAIVLVTTNEPVGRLHPGVVRPGRCWADIEFAPLAAGEARAWLAARGVDAPVGHEATLAELFALAAGRAVPARQGVGFAA
jgi:hypothetical protein